MMFWTGVRVMASLALALAIGAAAPGPPGSITVGFHHSGGCIGECPCFDTIVHEDGRVVAHSCESGAIWTADQIFYAAPNEIDEFRRILEPLRAHPPTRGECVGPPKFPFRNSTVIDWADRRPLSIKTCDGRASEAVEHALLAIGAGYWDGRRVPPEKREALREAVLSQYWPD
jgi:hypothetical protein